MKIAYVEDDADARSIYAHQLGESGIDCTEFDSAEPLLSSIRPGEYALLVMDIQLPGINGVQALKRLRMQGIATPCIIITAFSNAEYARDALNAEANYLIEKPFSFQDLLSVIIKVTAAPISLQACVDNGLAMLKPTLREEEVGRLLLKGLSNAEISRVLGLSEKTVKQYVSNLFRKAKTDNRADFFAYIFPV